MAWYTHSTDVGTHGPCVLLSNIGLYEEYGDTKDNPIEAAGYVAYGEKIDQSDLHAQIGFGAIKK